MIALLAIVFFLGMFIDTIAIIVICAPIFTPLITSYGIDPMWFAVCFMVALQCGYLTPPFGFSLFYMKSAASEDTQLKTIYLPFPLSACSWLALPSACSPRPSFCGGSISCIDQPGGSL